MKIVNLLNLSCLCFLLGNCNSHIEPNVKVILDSKQQLDSLSSGSGIVYANQHYYIVGDDSPWLYKVTETLNSSKLIKLSGTDSIIDGRTPKSLKTDFECMEHLMMDGLEYLVVLSSGSSQITRDTAVIYSLTDMQVTARKNIRPFFEQIKEKAAMHTDDEINIEGLAISDKQSYLLHRGNISGNIIISLSKESLFNYLSHIESDVPAFEIYHFKLPELEGTQAGFSGACMMPDNSAIIFTASVEKTADVYNDGAIAGSFVGIIPLAGLKDGEYLADLLLENGKVLAKKLEGVAVKEIKDNKYHLLLVTDNDDGTSDLFKAQLIFQGN